MPLHGEEKRAYQRAWRQKRRDDWMADKSCVVCGSVENLEVDHIDPATKVGHSVWSWSIKRRDAELAKCQVLCKPCHVDKTNKDFGWGKYGEHGSVAMYVHQGCRCAPCTAANTEYAKRPMRRR